MRQKESYFSAGENLFIEVQGVASRYCGKTVRVNWMTLRYFESGNGDVIGSLGDRPSQTQTEKTGAAAPCVGPWSKGENNLDFSVVMIEDENPRNSLHICIPATALESRMRPRLEHQTAM